jgi:CubicO group peptidase (beta-lactamase class C family)
LKVADKAGALPAELKGKGYDDPLVMKAYLGYCRRAIEFFKPDYLAIGIEVNEIHDLGPRAWGAYVALHKHVYTELRKDHPNLPIFASWTLHNMFKQRGQMLEQFKKLMAYNDLVAVSYYPFFMPDKDRLAALDWMFEQFDTFQKPYAVVETNDAVERLPLPQAKVVIEGTPEKQSAYYRRLLTVAQQHHFAFVISFVHQDYDALWEKIKTTAPELFMAWRNCGLLDANGKGRPVLQVWKGYFDLPLSRSGSKLVVFPGRDWLQVVPALQGVDARKLNIAVEFLGQSLSDYGSTGTVFIVRNGNVIWAGPDSDKEYQIFSATKSFTSTVLGLLIQDGRVSLSTLAKNIEPSLAEHYSSVTLRHFATMTSGYDSVGGSYEFDAQGRGDSWNPGPPAPSIFPPGTRFRYWDDAMSQFGVLLTKAAGTPLDQVFKARIADPIGMTHWRWTKNDAPTGRVLSVQGGIWTSSRELARFGHLFLNRGNWNGRQLIDAAWVDQATTVQVPASIPNDVLPRSRGAGVYGYNWWVNGVKPDGQRLWPGAPPKTFYANGLHNNVCIVIPEWKMVVARTNGPKKDGSTGSPANVDEIWSGFFVRLAEAVAPRNL